MRQHDIYSRIPRRLAPAGMIRSALAWALLISAAVPVQAQVRELLSNYGPIGILWFDGGSSFRGQPMAELVHAQEIVDMIHQVQPMCLVNNRLGLPADYGTPEQRIPGEAPKNLFEVCMTLNDHWGYNKYDNNWKSPETIIRNLADIAGKGGNEQVTVAVPQRMPDPIDTVVVLEIEGKPDMAPAQ